MLLNDRTQREDSIATIEILILALQRELWSREVVPIPNHCQQSPPLVQLRRSGVHR